MGFHVPFNLLTPYDLEGILGDILKTKKIDPRELEIKSILSVISKIKNTNGSYPKDTTNEVELVAHEIFSSYVHTLRNLNSVDFDDLILLPMKLLQENKDVQEYYHHKYKFFMVDEFQDTNLVQYGFLKLIMGANQNLCVVGDDDQSIYAFRGSDISLILNFEKDFSNAKVVKLLRNYRSTTQILQTANSLIKHNINRREKQLWSSNESGEKPQYVERLDEKDEASYVVDCIEKEVIKNKVKGSEIAILFRTNYQSRPFEEELRLRSIPYKLIGAYNFFDRKEVRDLIAYLKVIANPKDEISLFRIINFPKRGLGDGTIAKIYQKSTEEEVGLFEILLRICEKPGYIDGMKSKQSTAIYEFINMIQKYKKEFFTSSKMTPVLSALIKEINFEKEFSLDNSDEKVMKAKLLNLSELVRMLSFFESNWDSEEKPNLFDFIMRLALLMEDDNPKEDAVEDNRIQLMTMHLSKGMEYTVVFLVGLEEGILPNSRAIDESNNVDEERRLLYVGITRAKEKLFITGARERKKFGESMPSVVSRFISEIDPQTLDSYNLEKGETQSSSSFLDELDKLLV